MPGIRVVGFSLQHVPLTRLRFGQFSRLVVHDGYAKERRNVRRNGRDIRIAPNPKLGGSAASMAVHVRIFWQKDLPSSLVQLRIAVWTGDTRDTRPICDMGGSDFCSAPCRTIPHFAGAPFVF